MDTITYTATSTILNFIPEKKKNFQKIVASGTIFFLVGMLLCGPTPIILPDEVYIICIGILIGGIGGALINNNCVPALNQILDNQMKLYSQEQMNQLKNNLSAINTGAFGFGSILGPILAAVLADCLTYRWAFTICSIIVLFVSIIQISASIKKSDDVINQNDENLSSIYMSDDDQIAIMEERNRRDTTKAD